jgi:hypothetical protein
MRPTLLVTARWSGPRLRGGCKFRYSYGSIRVGWSPVVLPRLSNDHASSKGSVGMTAGYSGQMVRQSHAAQVASSDAFVGHSVRMWGDCRSRARESSMSNTTWSKCEAAASRGRRQENPVPGGDRVAWYRAHGRGAANGAGAYHRGPRPRRRMAVGSEPPKFCGELTRPRDCEVARHVSWRRATKPSDSFVSTQEHQAAVDHRGSCMP